MNARIVRPLNFLLRTMAASPLQLVKSEVGWILQDERAVMMGGGRNEPTSPPIIITPPPACAIPDFTAAVGVMAIPVPYVHCGGSHPDASTQGVPEFCAISGMTSSCTYHLRVYIDAYLPTSGATCFVFADADLAHMSAGGGADCGTLLYSGYVDIDVLGSTGGFYLLFYCSAGAHVNSSCSAEIMSITLLGSTP